MIRKISRWLRYWWSKLLVFLKLKSPFLHFGLEKGDILVVNGKEYLITDIERTGFSIGSEVIDEKWSFRLKEKPRENL